MLLFLILPLFFPLVQFFIPKSSPLLIILSFVIPVALKRDFMAHWDAASCAILMVVYLARWLSIWQ